MSSSLGRAAAVQGNIRVVKRQPMPVIAALLDVLFASQVGGWVGGCLVGWVGGQAMGGWVPGIGCDRHAW